MVKRAPKACDAKRGPNFWFARRTHIPRGTVQDSQSVKALFLHIRMQPEENLLSATAISQRCRRFRNKANSLLSSPIFPLRTTSSSSDMFSHCNTFKRVGAPGVPTHLFIARLLFPRPVPHILCCIYMRQLPPPLFFSRSQRGRRCPERAPPERLSAVLPLE